MPKLSFLDLPGLSARESAEPGFALALSALGQRLNLDPNYIGAVMSLESGFNPAATNPKSGSTGLIQFMPATAILLGTTADALRAMSAIQQLAFVEAFYRKTGLGIRKDTPGDYYMATFLPKYVGAPPDTVLGTKGDGSIYDSNAALDVNGDGVLTVSDVWAKINDRVAGARSKPMLVIDTDAEKKTQPLGAPAPLASSSPPASPSSSSGPPSGSNPGGAPSMPNQHRELVLFAASCELEDMALLVENHNAAGVDGRLEVYWSDVLANAADALAMVKTKKSWCGAFALWCIHQAGLGLEQHWEFGPPHFGFLYSLRQLEPGELPQAGDVAYLDKPYQHHAIVVSVEGGEVHTINGNQGPAAPIKEASAPLAHWTAFYSIERLVEAVA